MNISDYSIINNYDYQSKSLLNKSLDWISNPIRTIFGGKSVNLETRHEETASKASRVVYALLSIIIFPIGLASAISFAVKVAFIDDEMKVVKEKIQKISKQVLKTPPSKLVAEPAKAKVSSPVASLNTFKVSQDVKKKIEDGEIDQRTLVTEYEKISENRKPKLIGYSQYSPPCQRALTLSGIALMATILSEKNQLKNFKVCQDRQVFQSQLKSIADSPENQRHAFIIPTHSTLCSRGHQKSEVWEQHMVSVCVEKIDGKVYIYLLETMIADWNTVKPEQINLKEGKPFSELELVLANVDAAGLSPDSTTIYTPSVRRETQSGCQTFALRDSVYFLRDTDFRTKLRASKNPYVKLPASGVGVYSIKALPPEWMQLTQSSTALKQYKKDYPETALELFGPHQRKLQESLEKHAEKGNPDHNLHVGKRVLKYLYLAVDAYKKNTDEEIDQLVKRSLITK